MDPTKNWRNSKIKTSPKDRLDLILGENRDPLLITKKEHLYNVDATINYRLLIDKSKGERHKKSDKFEVLQELKRIWVNFYK